MLEVLQKALRYGLTWAIGWVRDTGEGLTQLLFEGLDGAGVPDAYLTSLSAYFSQINYVFPLFEVIGMATATFNVIVAVWGIKTALRYLPFT